MKNIRYLFVMVFAVMLSVSCSSDDDNGSDGNDSALVGTWVVTEVSEDIEEEVLLTFNANNSGVLVYSITFDGATETETENFTWSTSGNRLTMVSVGESEIVTYSISGNTLTVTDSDNDTIVFTRLLN